MAITVKWSVSDMKRNAADGGVVEVRWTCVASADTGESAVEGGKLTCNPDASAEGFVAYESLTEEMVLGWVKADLGAEKVAEIESVRTAKVEAQIARKTSQATGMPWATQAA